MKEVRAESADSPRPSGMAGMAGMAGICMYIHACTAGEGGVLRLAEALTSRFPEVEQKAALAQLFSLVRGK